MDRVGLCYGSSAPAAIQSHLLRLTSFNNFDNRPCLGCPRQFSLVHGSSHAPHDDFKVHRLPSVAPLLRVMVLASPSLRDGLRPRPVWSLFPHSTFRAFLHSIHKTPRHENEKVSNPLFDVYELESTTFP